LKVSPYIIDACLNQTEKIRMARTSVKLKNNMNGTYDLTLVSEEGERAFLRMSIPHLVALQHSIEKIIPTINSIDKHLNGEPM
jgi:hypothetical protein